MSIIKRIIIFLLVIGVSACVSNQSNMSAANDEDKDIGLGGTGLLANAGSGLGGTGIVGQITGFGSIFVNGIEIEYDSKTAFTIDGKTAAALQLEIGDVVEVLTTDDNQHTQARIINLRHEVIGRVESVDPQTFSYTVHGQTVVQAINKTTFPEIGATVAVSGFRIDEQTILSTRVTPVDAKQTLLRTHTELPFKEKAVRWLVETHVHDGKTILQLDGAAHTLTLKEEANESLQDRLGIRILQLQKSASGQLKVDRVIGAADVPRGRQTLHPVRQPDINIMPGSAPGTAPGSTPRSAPGSIQGPKQGPIPGGTIPSTQINMRSEMLLRG